MKNFNEQTLLTEAWLLESAQNYAGAEQIFTNLIKIAVKEENLASYYQQRGFLRRCLKKYELSLEDYDASIALNPQNNSTYWMKSVALTTWAFSVKLSKEMKKKLLHRAFECIEQSKKLEVNAPVMWSDLIEQCLVNERFTHVIAYYGESKYICNNTFYQIINEYLLAIAYVFLKKTAINPISACRIPNNIWSTVEVESFLLEKYESGETACAQKAINIHLGFLKNNIDGKNLFVYDPFHERFTD